MCTENTKQTLPLKDKNGLTEAEFLASYRQGDYPRPSLTADLVIFVKNGEGVRLLMIRRGGHPYLGCWAVPGGFAEPGESIEETAARELEEETCLRGLPLVPVGLFSKPGRDPRGWVVSQAFVSVLSEAPAAVAADDAAEVRWFSVEKTPAGALRLQGGDAVFTLPAAEDDTARPAFDHGDVILKAAKAANLFA